MGIFITPLWSEYIVLNQGYFYGSFMYTAISEREPFGKILLSGGTVPDRNRRGAHMNYIPSRGWKDVRTRERARMNFPDVGRKTS